MAVVYECEVMKSGSSMMVVVGKEETDMRNNTQDLSLGNWVGIQDQGDIKNDSEL